MPLQPSDVLATGPCVSLVDGDPTIRRARQLMLRSQNYEVRAYSTCAALLGDPAALRSACIIGDVEMDDLSGLQLLRGLRRAGWQGSAVLLADTISPELAAIATNESFAVMLPKALADRPLLEAVRSAIRERISG